MANGDRAQTITRLPASNIDPSLAPTSSQNPTPTIPLRQRSRTLYPNKRQKTDENSETAQQLSGVQCAIETLIGARNPTGAALALLTEVYEPLLEEDHFDMVVELPEDEKKATSFNALSGKARDRWLQKHTGVEVRQVGWLGIEAD